MNKFLINKIKAQEVFDSRGNPTLACEVELTGGIKAQAKVPSGASRGKFEALELRDNDPSRFSGKGVLKAKANVEKKIGPHLQGIDVTDQKKIDQIMIKLDGTPNKSSLGANAILGVSLACAKAAAKAKGISLYRHLRELGEFKLSDFSLPYPMVNVINGGSHAKNNLSFQEFLFIPKKEIFQERFEMINRFFKTLKEIFEKQNLPLVLGDEGGLAPDLKSNKEALNLILKATDDLKFKKEEDFTLGLDVAASSFFDQEKQKYNLFPEKFSLTTQELINYLKEIAYQYPLETIEDGLMEEDWEGWQKLTSEILGLKPNFKIIGDDLFVTQISRLQKGINLKVANALIIKPNQVGTLSETLACIKLAYENDYQVVISHRSGETDDDFIADLAVAVNAAFIKTGNITQRERLVKYYRLLQIEKELRK